MCGGDKGAFFAKGKFLRMPSHFLYRVAARLNERIDVLLERFSINHLFAEDFLHWLPVCTIKYSKGLSNTNWPLVFGTLLILFYLSLHLFSRKGFEIEAFTKKFNTSLPLIYFPWSVWSVLIHLYGQLTFTKKKHIRIVGDRGIIIISWYL